MTVHPKVAVVVLHWHGLVDTLACLDSLRAVQYPNWQLILVLNGSSKDDETCLVPHTSTSSHVIRLATNVGFAQGCNVGITAAIADLKADYVLLLNNDTIVDPGFLELLVTRAESDPQIGIVGAKTYYFASHRLQFTVGEIDLWRGLTYNRGSGQHDAGQFDQPCETEYVHGACLLMKVSVVQYVGLFDEKFFAYWEETDLCLRARKKGYKVFYEPKAIIWHKVSRSSPSNQVLYYLLRNNIYFMWKHAQWYQWLTFLPCFVLRTTLFQAAKPFLHDPIQTVRAIVKAYWNGFRMPPSQPTTNSSSNVEPMMD